MLIFKVRFNLKIIVCKMIVVTNVTHISLFCVRFSCVMYFYKPVAQISNN